MSKDNSGPAFPQQTCELCGDPIGHMDKSYTGMTRRELIAMGQLQVIRKIYPGMDPRDIAIEAIEDADALLAELAKE